MRYYGFALKASEELIKKNATVKLREYDFDSAIAAMNKYFYQKRRNGISFLAYREEEGDVVLAVFCFEEKIISFDDAYEYILDMIHQPFGISRVRKEPYEITGHEYYECIQEAKRRDIGRVALMSIEEIGLSAYSYMDRPNDAEYLHFSIEEMIVPENKIKATAIYDPEFVKELSNIEEHVNTLELQGNMVHYIISGRSGEVTKDMTEMLAQRLYAAKRIRSRRIVRIYDMDINLHMGYKYFEEMIERNCGGIVVIDLSEKFGRDPIDYNMMSKFIEKMVKAYRNDCLFIFTYNMDNPGFSYLLLPQIRKYIIPVALKEGCGDRKAAVAYLQKLIKGTDYAEYAAQAGEFMKQYPGKLFSQTDVIMAHEQFDAWCMNRNVLKAYNYDFSDDFMVDRMVQEKSSYEKLNNMVGLNLVKEQIKKILANNILERERKRQKGSEYETGTMHMIFAGNPGSAKTTVAKLFAGIAKEKGVLKSGAFVERGGMDFNGPFSASEIRRAFEAAKGGVLFVDEAYALKDDVAVTVLIQEMENRRDDVIVVLAGYNERMNKFMEMNEGLKSRIPYWIDFPDYNTQELTEIFKLMLREKGISATEEVIQEAQYIFDKARYVENFGNGRYVRNLLEQAIQNQSARLLEEKKEVSGICKKELFLIIKEDIAVVGEGLKDVRESGTARKELDEMIGLSSVKEIIKKAIADFKIKKFCMEKGIRRGKASMHMVFTGNPGTAKTTVARLFAEIMGDEKILPTGKFVEAGRADLIGTHVGETAPLVKSKFREAQGGILFIDEAYALCDNGKNSYGDEAINTLVQEMENHREDTIVVFAGYPEQMKEFLDRNPGLSSRIAFHVDFEDYSVDELCDITKLMVSKKEMTITDEAMEKLRAGYEKASASSDYGNGRFVRKTLEEAEMNLAQRLSDIKEEDITLEMVTTIEARDIPKMNVERYSEKKTIGFRIA